MNAKPVSLLIVFLFFFFQGLSQAKVAGDILIPLQSKTLQKNDNQFFIENKGQWDADILYMANFGGLNAFITKKGIVYDFYELKEVKDSKKEIRSAIPNSSNEPEPPEMEKYGHMIRINLLGCNEKAVPVGKEKSKTYYNYLIAGDTAHSRGYVGLYKEAVLKSVYEDIDMRYYFEGNSLRYDYILKPGANASQIKMQLEGSEHSYINSDGEWIFTTRFGEVKNTKLLSYQIIDGEKKGISSKFKKDTNGNIVFELGAYDDTKELVIDPLVASTLIGSFTDDYGGAITLDDSGNVYMAGSTYIFGWQALNFFYPATPGAYTQFIAGTNNEGIVISKFSADLGILLYSTYFINLGLGNIGNKHVKSRSIVLGPDKTINIVGDFSGNTGTRSFFVRLNSDGSVLQHAKLDGLPEPVIYTSVAVEKNKNYIISSGSQYVGGPFFPPVMPAPIISDTLFKEYYLFGMKATLYKYDSSDNLMFMVFFGNNAMCSSVAVDSSGNIYAAGYFSMSHSNYPFPMFYDSTFNGGNSDVFIAKFNPNGVLLYLSYLGGAGGEVPTAIKLDKQGNIYVLGTTSSADFPTTAGCLKDTLSGASDIFISKFDPTGTNLLYSTRIGGAVTESSTGLQVDSLGQMYFSGEIVGQGLPTTLGCFDDSYNGGPRDVFVAKINSVGDSLLYSTYFGGPDYDLSGGLAIDKFGNAYLTGSTLSGISFPTTLGSYHQAPYGYGGYYDIFVSKLKLTPCPVLMATASSNWPLFVGDALSLSSTMTGGILPYTYQWFGPNGFSSTLQNVTLNNITMADSGIYAVNITDANGCNASDTSLASIDSLLLGNRNNTIFYVYPNPNNGTFIIKTSRPGIYELFDMSGQMLNSYEVENSPYLIREKLLGGLYFIREKAGGIPNKFGPTQKILIE